MDNSSEEMKMTYSAVVAKDGKPVVAVRFERGKDYAEALLPDCSVRSSNGFNEEEIAALEFYLKHNKKDIGARAKAITGIQNFFGD
ncbi:MAG: hypothetical protein K6F63_06990 [Lachnospiraceae bacterium]|nr:hypothetical protein [Lachnospiraceae bacterium]